ncbi:Uncharacterised protein [uncultured archaeon]|nr:Uncharacterised protein [uncultured archaeon]
MKALDPEYLLLLNNDTAVRGDFLSKLIDAIDSDEHIGFAGPIIYKYDFKGRTDIISVAGINLDMFKGTYHRIGSGEEDRGQYNSIMTVDYLEGSCLLIKRGVLDKIGLLNPRYFAYWEETDLCRRGLEAGYRCICVPTTGIWHKISSSKPRGMIIYYMTRNRLWFMRSHARRAELIFFLCYFFFRQFWTTAASFFFRRDTESLSAYLKGVFHGLLPIERFSQKA